MNRVTKPRKQRRLDVRLTEKQWQALSGSKRYMEHQQGKRLSWWDFFYILVATKRE